jgi:hypothetical protein
MGHVPITVAFPENTCSVPLMKYLMVSVLILAALGAGFYLGFDNGWEGAMSEMSAPRSDDGQKTQPQTPTFEWEFQKIAETEYGTPITRVILKANGKSHYIGLYDLSCNVETGGTLDPNQLSRVICWWGGGGYELGIFLEDGAYVVKRGTVDEGSAEVAGFRGDFQTLLTL